MVTSETFINPVNFEDALPVGGPWVGLSCFQRESSTYCWLPIWILCLLLLCSPLSLEWPAQYEITNSSAQTAYLKMASYILYVFEVYLTFLCCPFTYTRKWRLTSSEVVSTRGLIILLLTDFLEDLFNCALFDLAKSYMRESRDFLILLHNRK
jgi:hypothetical protein